MFPYGIDSVAGRLSSETPFFIVSPEKNRRTEKRPPVKEREISLPVFSVVASLAFCLLLGCADGKGDIIGLSTSGFFDEEFQIVDLPDRPGPPEAGESNPDAPAGAASGLLNWEKLLLIESPGAWFRCAVPDPDNPIMLCPPNESTTGGGVVIGVMEEVNHFHEIFHGGHRDKVHGDSIFGSPYPTTRYPVPDEKYIVEDADFREYPEYPCLMQFDDIADCPDESGKTKYFVRLSNGELRLLPGKNNTIDSIQCYDDRGEPNLDNPLCEFRNGNLRRIYVQGRCPEFDVGYVCPEFGASHGTGVASTALAVTISLGGRFNTGFRGLAYNSRLLVYARPLEIAGLPTSFNDHVSYLFNAPAAADVYNFSHVFSRVVQGHSRSFSDQVRRSNFSQLARAVRCLGTEGRCSEGTPLIAAAGNESEPFPRFPAALPLFFPELRGQVLAVTSTDNYGRISSYANRCGTLSPDWDRQRDGRHYCLAAPGGTNPREVEDIDEETESGVSRFWVAGPAEGEYFSVIGTSFAAPVVAGSFAILKGQFRDDAGEDTMSDRELLLRLVNTANNTDCTREENRDDNGDPCKVFGRDNFLRGDYSNEALYGAGMLDLNAATAPVGTQRMSAIGDINDGITYDFDAILLSTSAAFGDSLQRALQTHKIALFDELNAPFWYPLATFMETTSSRETLQERQARLFERTDAPVETPFGGRLALASTHAGSSEQIDMSLWQPVDALLPQAELLLTAGDLSTAPLGLHEDKSFAHPYLHFAGEGIGLGGSLKLGAGQLRAMGFTSGGAPASEDIPFDAHGGLIEYALEPVLGVALGMQAGAIVEGSRALGLLSEGGFGELGESSTAFAGVSLDGELDENWRLRANVLFGRTNLDTPSIGLLATSSPLASSAFRFALEGSDILLDDDRINFFVAQPLRIEGGEADFIIPVSRTPSGSVKRTHINGVSLEPGGRELEFGAQYEMQIFEDAVATGGIGFVHEGGHSKYTETELYGLANLRFHF